MVEEALKIKHLAETITLVCMRGKGEKSSYEPSGPSTRLELTPVSIATRD